MRKMIHKQFVRLNLTRVNLFRFCFVSREMDSIADKNLCRLLPRLVIVTSIMIFASAVIFGQERQQIKLNDEWIVRSLEEDEALPESLPGNFKDPGSEWYSGNMPKQVQEFILEKGELPDPANGDNAQKWVPIFQKDWLYCKKFETPGNLEDDVLLCFPGLDTEVDIYLNGKKIAYANNMHRRWLIPVKDYLQTDGAENILMLRFHPPVSGLKEYPSLAESLSAKPQLVVRKTWSDFNGYLGASPNFIKMGVFDEVYLDILPKSYFGDVYVRTELSKDFDRADILINPDISSSDKVDISYEVISPDGKMLQKKTVNASDQFAISIEEPQLWWPMNFGDQPLYTLNMKLLSKKKVLDSYSQRFGIRDLKVELKDERTGDPRFGFRINGKMIFMNGACWAPVKGLTHTWDKERADTLLNLMVLGNLNFLRIWGEGSIPGKSLFDKCDEQGIVIWMDFMVGASMQYHLENEKFRNNISAEIEDEIKRLRNYTCLAIWCGGNEHYKGYKSNKGDNTDPTARILFQKIMPELVGKFDPQRFFQPSSPWGGEDWIDGNYALERDFHDYSSIRYQPLASVPLFTSEVCMVSPYSLHNMRRFMSEDDFWPEGFDFSIDKPGKVAWPEGWQKHSLGTAWEKIGRIQDYCDIKNAEDACRVLGTAHGNYLKQRYERQRRGIPDGQPDGNRRSWGASIWRLNDTWPMIYMSAVDYYLEPKIPYYFLKRASEPIIVSFETTDDDISVWVVNDSPEEISDTLFVELWTFEGRMKKKISRPVSLSSSKSKRVLSLAYEFFEIHKRDEFIVARFADYEATHLLMPEKFLKLKDTKIMAKVIGDEIVLRSDEFVKDVALHFTNTSGAIFSDNYFNLIPGHEKRIKIIHAANGREIQIGGVNSEIIKLKYD